MCELVSWQGPTLIRVTQAPIMHFEVESRIMRVASGHVVDGRVELMDAELPEGAAVTVLLPEGDETFEADEETERMLLESIAQCERGETVPFESVLEELRRRG